MDAGAVTLTRAERRVLEERAVLRRVEREARAYARLTHGNLNGTRYREREEARDRLLDALAELDVVRGA